MHDSIDKNMCARAEEMVTFLYGEATREEAKAFEQHMQQCSGCRSELAAFGDVRAAVGQWRQQALGTMASPAVEIQGARNFATAQRRSALAALREFFTLSPTWMRAATGVAAIVFCALAAIAVAYFVQQPQTVVVEKPFNSGYTEKEVEEKIALALKKQNESPVKDTPEVSAQQVATARDEQSIAQPEIKRRASAASQLAKNNRRPQVMPRVVSRSSKMELASADYLPFTAPGDEEKLPSLADLVDEDNDE
jgi:anti-sigma factor RsiW